jgi:L-aminopeptidase/D-esterase-like protein
MAPPAPAQEGAPTADHALRFDFPGLEIGVATDEAGPTGVTVLHFLRPVAAAVDVRGGAPGTLNSDAIRVLADGASLDAIAIAGGSSYGLAAATGVQNALARRSTNPGAFDQVPFVAGSIIFDLGGRRFNFVTPDANLGAKALEAARPNLFPLGAVGAGRFANTGAYFGRSTYSGQGAAWRRSGPTTVLVFTVVNAYGAVVDRDGRVARCSGPTPDRCGAVKDWIADHVARLEPPPAAAHKGLTANTTITVVVTNQKMPYWELQRLAIQVHTSMARAIQPFSTASDGDTLYAVSDNTQVNPKLGSPDLGLLASEAAWDAVLASIPPLDPAPAAGPAPSPAELASYVGHYELARGQTIAVTLDGGALWAETPARAAYYFPDRRTRLEPISPALFRIPGPRGDRLSFVDPGGKDARIVVNPGHWPITAPRTS